MLNKVYIVISNTIIYEHESHGLHGAYFEHSDAKDTAMSVIKSTAGFDVNDSDIINEDDTEFSYQNDTLGIWVSVIEQEVM